MHSGNYDKESSFSLGYAYASVDVSMLVHIQALLTPSSGINKIKIKLEDKKWGGKFVGGGWR